VPPVSAGLRDVGGRDSLPLAPHPTHTHWALVDSALRLRDLAAVTLGAAQVLCSPLVTFVGFFSSPVLSAFFLWFSARRFNAPILYLLTLLFCWFLSVA